METKEVRVGEDMAFKAYGKSLTMESYLKYLGGVISVSDNNWPTVKSNIWKARKK